MMVFFVSCLKKCPPNKAMLVSGLQIAGTKIIVGGSAVVLPVVQQVHWVDLEVRTVKIKSLTPLVSADGVPLQIEVSAQIKVRPDNVSIMTVAEVMLDKSAEERDSMIASMLLPRLAVLVESMSAEQFKKQIHHYDDTGLLSCCEAINQDVLCKLGLACLSMSLDKVTENP
jgi:flotillin